MTQAYFSLGIVLVVLLNSLSTAGMDSSIKPANLEPMFVEDIWYAITPFCKPKTCSTLKKVCKFMYAVLSKNYPDKSLTWISLLPGISLFNEKFYGEIFLSCQKGYPAGVSKLLRLSKEIPFHKYAYAIKIALQKGHFECMRTILLVTPGICTTFLRDAVIYNNAEAVEFLLGKYALNPNQSVIWDTAKNPKFETLLHRAIRHKASGILQQLIRARANVTAQDSLHRTPKQVAQGLLNREPVECQKTSEYQAIIQILSAAEKKQQATNLPSSNFGVTQ